MDNTIKSKLKILNNSVTNEQELGAKSRVLLKNQGPLCLQYSNDCDLGKQIVSIFNKKL